MPLREALRWMILLIIALVAMTGLQRFFDGTTAIEPAQAAVPAWGPADFSEALQMLDRDVARSRARLAAIPDSWAAHEAVAMSLHARGQLNGSHDDLAEALESAEKARQLATDPSGPVLSRAIVNLALHRNDIAAEEIARVDSFAVPADPPDRAEAEAILGDVALYAGDYPTALARYRTAEALYPSAGSAVRLADWFRHQGQFERARATLKAGFDRPQVTPWTRAALLLQLGAIDLQTGDWDTAEQYFEQAEAAFPGWWLARAHLGQMAAVRGDFARAESLYREAMEGAERPSVMDALAAVLEAQGRSEEAARIAQTAAGMWKARVASHPEAYADHGFEASLAEGDTASAWQMASLNYRNRPFGDGRIGLARAAAARGRDESARAILEELGSTGWRSTEQYRVLAEVCERLEDQACVASARKAALAISPLAFDPRSDLLFFSNH